LKNEGLYVYNIHNIINTLLSVFNPFEAGAGRKQKLKLKNEFLYQVANAVLVEGCFLRTYIYKEIGHPDKP
jgi:hypothetical protein